MFDGLQIEGYRGSYDQVQRFVKRWKVERLKEPAVTHTMTVRTRLPKLEAAKPTREIMIPRVQVCRIFASFYDHYFPSFWRRAWRVPFADRLRFDQLTEDDRRMIDTIPAKFRARGDIRRVLADAVEGAETLPGMWRD